MSRRAGIFKDLREIWAQVTRPLRAKTIEDVADFRAFISSRGSLIAQKAAIDYCRGKTGAFSNALFTETSFQDALTICRWEAFAATLADLLIIAEGILRPYGGRDQLGAALREIYGAILMAYPVPEHRIVRGWQDVQSEFAVRLAAAADSDPQGAVSVANHSARRLFETLPIHTNYRALDEEVVFGAVRFRMVAVAQEMRRALVPERLAAALTHGHADVRTA